MFESIICIEREDQRVHPIKRKTLKSSSKGKEIKKRRMSYS